MIRRIDHPSGRFGVVWGCTWEIRGEVATGGVWPTDTRKSLWVEDPPETTYRRLAHGQAETEDDAAAECRRQLEAM